MAEYIQEVLEELDAVRERLLGVSDHLWQSISYQDAESLSKGCALMHAYIDKMDSFSLLATSIAELLQNVDEEQKESGVVTELETDEEGTQVITTTSVERDWLKRVGM